MINPQIENLQISRCASPLTAAPQICMIPVDTNAKKGKPTLHQTVPKELKKVPKAIYFSRFFSNLELENFKLIFAKRKIFIYGFKEVSVSQKEIGSENRKSANHKKEQFHKSQICKIATIANVG
jgi:hypothetical protein